MITRKPSASARAATAAAAILLLAAPARAALNVFACEPEWGALATALGGSDVSVFTATTALQDPHQIQARPALIARLRFADLAVCTGAELEIGWMPVLQRQAANAKVQPGAPGYFAGAEQVQLLEKPSVLDRSQGDVHPGGNPHVQTDPRNMRIIAASLARRMEQIDAAHAASYAERAKAFDAQIAANIARWQAEAAPLKGKNVVAYHQGWIYLMNFLGMREAATIEPKPGVPPGSAYIAELLDRIPKLQASMIIYAAYEDPKPSQFVAEKSRLPAVMLPFTVGGSDAAKDLTGLYDDTVKRLLAALGGARE
jgi:zinc/manganese transport system substrate-binding protein